MHCEPRLDTAMAIETMVPNAAPDANRIPMTVCIMMEDFQNVHRTDGEVVANGNGFHAKGHAQGVTQVIGTHTRFGETVQGLCNDVSQVLVIGWFLAGSCGFVIITIIRSILTLLDDNDTRVSDSFFVIVFVVGMHGRFETLAIVVIAVGSIRRHAFQNEKD